MREVRIRKTDGVGGFRGQSFNRNKDMEGI